MLDVLLRHGICAGMACGLRGGLKAKRATPCHCPYSSRCCQCAVAFAAADTATLRGRVHTPNNEIIQGLFVSVEDLSTHLRLAEIGLHIDGAFEFRDVPTGDYTIRGHRRRRAGPYTNNS